MRGKADTDLDTIDGEDRPQPEARGPSATATAPAPVLDYPELASVERRHYAVGAEIAKGGMGRVLEARDLRLGRAVAIKELLPRNRDLARRFEREARITARLQHPGIIHVYEAGVWPGGEPFYAMPKISGRSLDKVVAERATLAERLALLPNVIAVADALAYAHAESVIHRDLKPANVLVGEYGETVVIDWGLAKDLGKPFEAGQSMQIRVAEATQTNVGSVIGTPAYMPPEQATGGFVDRRSDVYSLGALLYHVLVGEPPYTGASSKDVLEMVKSQPVVPVRERAPGAPTDLVAIVNKAMARGPEQRYTNAGELAQDLRRFQTGQLVAAHRYTTPQLLWRWLRRHRVAVATTTVFVAAIAVLLAVNVNTVVANSRHDALRRRVLLEERGRSELLSGHPGRALVYLVNAAGTETVDGALGFLIAEAARPFEQVAVIPMPVRGDTVVATSPNGMWIAAAAGGRVQISDTRDGHHIPIDASKQRILAIAFDRTSQHLITAGDDGVARVWSTAGELERTLRDHTGPILDVAFSSLDDIGTASADGTAKIWHSNEKVSTSHCHNDPTDDEIAGRQFATVVSLRFSPNGLRVATADSNGMACVLWSGDGAMHWRQRGHTDALTAIRWTHDGDSLVTASRDGTVRVWNYDLGKPRYHAIQHDGLPILDVEVSKDDRHLLTAGSDHFVRLWELPEASADTTKLSSATLVWTSDDHDAPVDHMAFSDDGTQVATAGDAVAHVLDATTGRSLALFEHAVAVTSVAFDRARKHLITGSDDGTVRVWDVSTIAPPPVEIDSGIRALAVGPGGRLAVGRADSKITILRNGAHPVVLPGADSHDKGHLGAIRAVAFDRDGSHVVSAGEDDEAIVWQGNKELRRLPCAAPIHAAVFAPDGTLALGCNDGTIAMFSTAGDRVRTLAGRGPITALAYSPDGTLLVALDGDGQVNAWVAATGTELGRELRTQGGPAHAIAFSPDGNRLAVAATSDTEIYAVSGDAISARPIVTLDEKVGKVVAVAFSRDGSIVITGGDDGGVKLWDAETGKLIGRDPRHEAVSAIALDGDTLWRGGKLGTVNAWNLHVEARTVEQLQALIPDRVPYWLDHDDVVRPTSQRGDGDGQR